MILFLIYTAAGGYLLLLAFGALKPSFFTERDPYTRTNTRLALILFGVGMMMLGLYYGYIYMLVRPAIQKAEREYQEHKKAEARKSPPSSEAPILPPDSRSTS